MTELVNETDSETLSESGQAEDVQHSSQLELLLRIQDDRQVTSSELLVLSMQAGMVCVEDLLLQHM